MGLPRKSDINENLVVTFLVVSFVQIIISIKLKSISKDGLQAKIIFKI